MMYDTLKKIYYSNRSHYEEEYLSRFNGQGTFHVDFDIKSNPAFFIPTKEILSLDYNISKLDKLVRRIRSELPSAAMQQYYIKSLIDEVHLTLDIEQVVSTRKEIAEIQRGRKDNRLSGMINKYSTLMRGTHIPLETCQDVRALYDEICLPEVVSENAANRPDGEIFRKDQNQVVGRSEMLLHEGLYPEDRIISAMDKALLFLNKTQLSTPIRVAIFHYMIGYIHPFYDGNGRLSRFISSYVLSQDMDIMISVRLSHTIKENKNKYYKLFKETNNIKNKGDLTYFIMGFLEFLEISYQSLYEALKEKANLLKHYETILYALKLKDQKLVTVAYLLLQVALFSPSGMRFDEIKMYSHVPERAIRRFLTDKNTKPMFVFTKDGRANAYALNLDWLVNQQLPAQEANEHP